MEEKKNLLLKKLKEGTLTRNEAQYLKTILEKEKEEATKDGNLTLIIGIAALLGFVMKYLVDEKVIDLDKLTKIFSGKGK